MWLASSLVVISWFFVFMQAGCARCVSLDRLPVPLMYLTEEGDLCRTDRIEPVMEIPAQAHSWRTHRPVTLDYLTNLLITTWSDGSLRWAGGGIAKCLSRSNVAAAALSDTGDRLAVLRTAAAQLEVIDIASGETEAQYVLPLDIGSGLTHRRCVDWSPAGQFVAVSAIAHDRTKRQAAATVVRLDDGETAKLEGVGDLHFINPHRIAGSDTYSAFIATFTFDKSRLEIVQRLKGHQILDASPAYVVSGGVPLALITSQLVVYEYDSSGEFLGCAKGQLSVWDPVMLAPLVDGGGRNDANGGLCDLESVNR